MAGGRPRKPTALHDLQGTGQASRMNALEPVLVNRLPDKPEWIESNKAAEDLYNQVTMYVHKMGVGTEVDGMGLSLLAHQMSLYIEMAKAVHDEGTVITTIGSSGQERTITHPCIAQMGSTATSIFKIMREYGLTPSSRSNVSVTDEGEPDDKMAQFFE